MTPLVLVTGATGAVGSQLVDRLLQRQYRVRVLVRSRAALHICERLGGGWRMLARVVGLLPTWLLDWGYDRVARVRGRLFARPEGSCPMLPPELRGRFLP